MKAKADLEIVGGIIRVFDDAQAKFGDSFELALFILGDERTAILKALRSDKKLTHAHARTIEQCLIEHGFKECVWYRHVKNATSGEIEIRRVSRKLVDKGAKLS